jgi:hypothetical protein
LRDELVEARHKALELVFDTSLNSPLGDEIDILLLVFFVYFDVLTAWLEVDGDDFTESIVFDGEAVLDNVGDIVLAGHIRNILSE